MRMVFPTNMTGRFLDDLASEMNTFVESVLGDEAKASSNTKPVFTPRMDFDESEAAFVAYLDLPGVDPATVSIDMEDDHMIVQGERVKTAAADGVRHHRVERASGAFRRAIALPETVDKDAIAADYDHGVLTITLPKRVEEKKSRRIVISHAGTETAQSDDHNE